MKNQQAANEARSAEAAALWDARKSEIQRLYHQDGLSQAAVAAHYGITQSAMYKVMRRLGVKPKSRGRAGAENGRYLHGMASTIYRTKIKKKNCAECGATTALCVHHKNGNHLDNRKANLQVLCSPCHTSHHKKQYWEKRRSSQSSQTPHTE